MLAWVRCCCGCCCEHLRSLLQAGVQFAAGSYTVSACLRCQVWLAHMCRGAMAA